MSLRELRESKSLSQKEAARLLKMPVRTYRNYENQPDKSASLKYDYLLQELEKICLVDETHGILSLSLIKTTCQPIFKKYNTNFAYLFGSYAKGKATPVSDVDFLVDTPTTGLAFFGMAEELREALKKKVDLLDINQLKENIELTKEILGTGLKIYG
jgi:predicted nucleotidyltransferase/DNA-binding XRE family transcriptional regulator